MKRIAEELASEETSEKGKEEANTKKSKEGDENKQVDGNTEEGNLIPSNELKKLIDEEDISDFEGSRQERWIERIYCDEFCLVHEVEELDTYPFQLLYSVDFISWCFYELKYDWSSIEEVVIPEIVKMNARKKAKFQEENFVPDNPFPTDDELLDSLEEAVEIVRDGLSVSVTTEYSDTE